MDVHQKRIENPEHPRPKAPRKDYDKFVAKAWKAGWWCVRSGKNYIKCYPPDDGKVVIVPSTPKRGGRGQENLKALFRDRGLDV